MDLNSDSLAICFYIVPVHNLSSIRKILRNKFVCCSMSLKDSPAPLLIVDCPSMSKVFRTSQEFKGWHSGGIGMSPRGSGMSKFGD